MIEKQVSKENFIENLDLPDGVEARNFNGMSRVHFKYNEKGFAVIDMKASTYNFASRPEHLRAIGITKHDVTYNLGPNRAIIWDIPYSDTTYLYKLINYITGKTSEEENLDKTLGSEDKNISDNENNNTVKSIDINTPIAPKKRIINTDGTVRLTCGSCGEMFFQAPRCPECGQLVLQEARVE